MDVLMNLPVIIICNVCVVQTITLHTLNIQCFMSVMSQESWKIKKGHPHFREVAAHGEETLILAFQRAPLNKRKKVGFPETAAEVQSRSKRRNAEEQP